MNRSSSIPVVARHSRLFLGYEKFSMFAFCPKATHFSYSHRNKSNSENSVVELQNHELNEQLMLISQLDEDEKNALVKITNSMLTKKRMKDLLDGKVNL